MDPEIYLVNVYRPLPPPTDAVPGTGDKTSVLIWRHQNGYALWHPNDAIIADIDSPNDARVARVAAFH